MNTESPSSQRRGIPALRVGAILAGLVTIAALGGCGSSGDDSTSTASSSTQAAANPTVSTATASSTTTADSCGTIPTTAPKDPDGLVAALGDRYATAYNGWSNPIQKSPWAAWKPKGPGPYTVGVSFEQITNPFQSQFLKSYEAALRKSPLVKDVIIKTSDGTVPSQLAQYESLARGGADIILVQPHAPQPFVGPIEEAAKADIPTMSLINPTPTPDAINVGPNNWLASATGAAGMAKITGGKGTYAYVHGIPGTSSDDEAFAATKQTLALCPDIKLEGDIVGQYAPPVVKSEMLKYLSTHPGKIDAVLQTATMAPPIIGAFQQSGRDVPPVSDVAAQVGSVAYWNDNKDKGYDTVGVISGATGMANAVAELTVGLLQGRGLKINDVALPTVQVTSDDVADWVTPGATLETPGTVDGDGTYYTADGYIDGVFAKAASGQ